MKKKLIIICGPTGTGKTELATSLAEKFPFEIISADSRQVYKYMDIGTGKASRAQRKRAVHHLIDSVDPRKTYSAADFVTQAIPLIEKLWKNEKIPLIEGGTGFYLTALIDGIASLGVEPNVRLREELSLLTTEQLFERLKKLNPKRAKTIDKKNPRRLVRAIEISKAVSRKDLPTFSYDEVLFIGLIATREYLYQQSDKRTAEVVEKGLIEEVKKLLEMGYDWSLPSMSSIWYLPVRQYLEKKMTKEELVKKLQHETHGYIRRQLTWFQKDTRIEWFDVTKPSLVTRVEKRIEKFLQKETSK